MLLALSFLQILGALSASLPPLNLTNLGSYSKPAPGNLRLHPMPNPFQIPGTDIALQWDPIHDPDHPLPEVYTIDAFLKCKARADAHVRHIGDGPIGERLFPGHFVTVYKGVVIEFASDVPGVILYSEVSDILTAVSWKMLGEGYRSCWVRVWRTREVLLGERLGRVSVRDAV